MPWGPVTMPQRLPWRPSAHRDQHPRACGASIAVATSRFSAPPQGEAELGGCASALCWLGWGWPRCCPPRCCCQVRGAPPGDPSPARQGSGPSG